MLRDAETPASPAGAILEPPGGIRGLMARWRNRAGDSLMESMARFAELDMARQIARDIRGAVPEHKCDLSAPCYACGLERGLEKAAEIALKTGAKL